MFRFRVASRLMWRPPSTVSNRQTVFLAVFAILYLNVCNVNPQTTSSSSVLSSMTSNVNPQTTSSSSVLSSMTSNVNPQTTSSSSVLSSKTNVCNGTNKRRKNTIIRCVSLPSSPLTPGECITDVSASLNGFIKNIRVISESITNASTREEKRKQFKKVRDSMLFVVDEMLTADEENNTSSKVKEGHMQQVLEIVEGLMPALVSAMDLGERQETIKGKVGLVLANLNLTNKDPVHIRNSRNGIQFRQKLASGQTNVAVAMSVIAGDVGSGFNREDDQAKKGQKLVLNTDIVVLSLAKSTQLEKNVTITFQVLHRTGFGNPVCVSLAANPGAKLQSQGCTTQGSNSSGHITCSCNHLTSFAVLMSVTEEGRAQQEEDLVQDILSTVCLSLSLVCLFLSFVTFISLQGLESERNTIHTNLTACLFLAQLLFLVGIDQTDDETVCAVIAGLLHFLCLATFMWMLNEGVCLYIKLVIVFELTFSIMPVMYAVGYGIPIVIVVVSAVIFPEGYGTEKVCWLSLENGFIYSFVGPVILVAVFDFAMLCVAVRIMVRHGQAVSKDQQDMYKRWAKGSFALLSTFGITWVFGLFALGGSGTAVFAYLFVILNGCQGVFIFVFHCLLGDRVKKEYRRVILSMTCLPDPIQRCLVACLGASRMDTAGEGISAGPGKGTLSQFIPSTAQETSTSIAFERQAITSPIIVDKAGEVPKNKDTDTRNQRRESAASIGEFVPNEEDEVPGNKDTDSDSGHSGSVHSGSVHSDSVHSNSSASTDPEAISVEERRQRNQSTPSVDTSTAL